MGIPYRFVWPRAVPGLSLVVVITTTVSVRGADELKIVREAFAASSKGLTSGTGKTSFQCGGEAAGPRSSSRVETEQGWIVVHHFLGGDLSAAWRDDPPLGPELLRVRAQR